MLLHNCILNFSPFPWKNVFRKVLLNMPPSEIFHHSFHLKLFEGRVCRQEMASPSERLNCERNFVFMMAAPRRTLGDGTGSGSGSKAQAKKWAFVEEAFTSSTLTRISEKL